MQYGAILETEKCICAVFHYAAFFLLISFHSIQMMVIHTLQSVSLFVSITKGS